MSSCACLTTYFISHCNAASSSTKAEKSPSWNSLRSSPSISSRCSKAVTTLSSHISPTLRRRTCSSELLNTSTHGGVVEHIFFLLLYRLSFCTHNDSKCIGTMYSKTQKYNQTTEIKLVWRGWQIKRKRQSHVVDRPRVCRWRATQHNTGKNVSEYPCPCEWTGEVTPNCQDCIDTCKIMYMIMWQMRKARCASVCVLAGARVNINGSYVPSSERNLYTCILCIM